jgi:PilZ domain
MTDRSVRGVRKPLSENPADRRRSPRLKAEDVPWIVTVRIGYGDDSARLVDISRTGLLLETRERLRPGQKGIMTLGLAGDQTARIDSHIVRSNLVALSPDAVPIYHAAILFSKELESKLLAPAPVEPETDAETGSGLWSLHLDGPFDALVATGRSSELARVTNLSETGCISHLPMPVEAGEVAAVTIIFTPVRRLLLAGRVTEVRSDGARVMRFEGLSPEQRRALRVELTSHAMKWTTSSQPSGYGSLFSMTGGTIDARVFTAGLHASDW